MRELMALWLASVAFAACATEFSDYRYPVTEAGMKITLEDCIPSAMAHLRRGDFLTGKGMAADESVVVVTDRSVDPLVSEAYSVAAQRLGAHRVDTISLHGRLDVTDPTTLILELFETNAWPEWVWAAAAQADRVLALSFTSHVHALERRSVPGQGLVTRWSEETGTEFQSVRMFRERLCTGEPYPGEILHALVTDIWQTLENGRKYHLTDPNGTDLIWTVNAKTWARYLKVFGSQPNNHAPRLHLAEPPDMHGTLVSRRLHSGTIPEIRLSIEAGRVVAIEGGGRMGEYMREAMAKYALVQYPLFPGPGVHWVEYAVWGWIPHLAPAPNVDELRWVGRFVGEQFENRAGVVHLAIGTAAAGLTAAFSKEHRYPIHHKDFNIYRATLTVDGRTIIDDGHLLALDDPEIRRIASKYGDPDRLLRTIWEPGDDPRF